MIPKDRPETGGREGLMNAGSDGDLLHRPPEPSPRPGTGLPRLLSLHTTSAQQSGRKASRKPLRTGGSLEASPRMGSPAPPASPSPLAHHKPSGGWRWVIFRPHSAMLSPHLPSWGGVGWGTHEGGQGCSFPCGTSSSKAACQPLPRRAPLSGHPIVLLQQFVVGKAEHLLEENRHSSTQKQQAILEPGI